MKKKFSQEEISELYTEAFKNREFFVYYQPKINLKNYTLAGAEALVRWNHEGDMIMPDDFIQLLEHQGTIKELDFFILNCVCADIKEWIRQGKKPVQISVNFSRKNITTPNIVQIISETIKQYEIDKNLIQIELTETAEQGNSEKLKNLIIGLHNEGISTAVDDFGTGFSSLSLIRELPWNTLKIDKSLLYGAEKKGSREQLVYKSIITMAKGLGLECVTEGVETKEQISLMKECECFVAQGFYFDRPLARIEFEKRLG